MSVDALGNPLRFILTGGQEHDITQAHGLIAGYESEYVIGDKGYDAQQFRRIFSRFEKLDTRYLAFLHFAGALIWLR